MSDNIYETVLSIKQAIHDYDYQLDTNFERNAATIALQRIREILGMEPYQQGKERKLRAREVEGE